MKCKHKNLIYLYNGEYERPDVPKIWNSRDINEWEKWNPYCSKFYCADCHWFILTTTKRKIFIDIDGKEIVYKNK